MAVRLTTALYPWTCYAEKPCLLGWVGRALSERPARCVACPGYAAEFDLTIEGVLIMLTQASLNEFRSAWLPNITDQGLSRLADLLEKASPLLIHGSFTRVVPQGCLATHIAWYHPQT